VGRGCVARRARGGRMSAPSADTTLRDGVDGVRGAVQQSNENEHLRAPVTTPAPAEPWLATLLRALVHGLAAGVFAWPLAVREGVVAAAVGGLVGALAARGLARTRLRLGTLVVLAVAALVGVLAVAALLTGGDALAASLGPSRALRVGDVLVFGPGALVVSAGLRMLAARVRALAVLEVAGVALAFAQLVVAHRNGAINRPFELADPILARGGDPSLAILAVGAGAVGVVVVLLLSERSAPRALFGLGLLAALLAGLLVVTARVGLPSPPQTGGGLGLRGDGEGRAQPQQGGGRGGRASEDLEFRDDYGASNRQVPVASSCCTTTTRRRPATTTSARARSATTTGAAS